MKRFIYSSLLFLVLFALPACSVEPEVITKDREILLDPETPSAISSDRDFVRASAETESVSFTISSAQGWAMMENHEGWLSVSPQSSEEGGEVTVTVTMQQNELYADRSVELLFYSNDNETKVQVVQLGIPAPEFCCDLSSKSVLFEAGDTTAKEVTVTTYNESVTLSAEGIETFCKSLPTEIAAGETATLTLTPPPSLNISDKREATVTFTGKDSGKMQTLTVKQKNLYTATHGFPAKWETSGSLYSASTDAGKRWLNQGYSFASGLDGSFGNAIITAVSASEGRKPVYSIYSKTTAVANLTTDDYLLFCVPVTSVSAGCDFDFCLSLGAASPQSPKYFIFEYLDGGEWKSVEQDLKVVPEDNETKYSFYVKKFDSYNYTTFVQSFTLQNPIENDFVKMRCRIVNRVNGAGETLYANEAAQIFFPRFTFMTCYINCYEDAPAVKDTHKIMALGNSFTYYYATVWMFKEIARREGHQVRMRANLKGSMAMKNHLQELEFSQNVVAEGGYDYALLQDSSYNSSAAFYKDGCKPTDERLLVVQQITENIRKASPSCKQILEQTWAYPRTANDYRGYGSYENFFNHLYNGALAVRDMTPNLDWVSPIGVAFKKATEEGYSLLYTDSFHQNRNGAYLKACVNYLMIYGEKFGDNPAECGVDATIAKRLREIAEEVVLGNESTYKKQ
ncbi:MAG: BACON domain-containing protein [Alistipes sp.]|nr:BACON domain-containing protein [Alistipes sp.]